MKRVCSWCGITIQPGTTPTAVVTHSICPTCIAKIDEQITDLLRARDLIKTER